MKTLIKSNIKEFIASNKVVAKLYYALFKEQVSIKVKDKNINYYMSPLFGRTLKGIDVNGEYEGPFLSRLINDLLNYSPEKQICYLDIGGSFGFDILVLDSFLTKQIDCYTFEPDKFSQIYLKRNVAEIPVKIIDKFVGEKSEGDYISIDDFCEAEKVVPSHIKIDIEGSEIHALKGMVKTLKKSKPRLYIEMHEIFIRNRLQQDHSAIEEFFQTLTELGYELEFNSHHYPLFAGKSNVYDYNWFTEKPNDQLYAVVCS
ncbi:MAG: FkbM family methyltransferase [Cyanobacteria bacterium P01_A01_bin.40]